MEPKLFDVVAVNIETQARRTMQAGMTEEDAEAFITMAVMRRGVDEEFYTTVPSESGTTNEGN